MTTKLSPSSTLSHHVSRVLSLGAQPEMGWAGTRGVVTAMAYVHALGDGAVQSDPDVAVDSPDLVVDIDLAISTVLSSARPYAAISFLNESGKNADQRIGTLGCSRRNRAFDWSTSSPPLVVSGTPSPCVVGSTTPLNDTRSLCHVGPPHRFGSGRGCSRSTRPNHSMRRG